MTQLASSVCLPTLLLLLLLFCLPGCVPLHGPSTVTGTVGESLSVKCQYEEEFKTNNKYWCRGSQLLLCKEIVKTRSSKEARNGRVSIRDHPDNLTFTVTLENLTLEDADTYMCRVDIRVTDTILLFDDYFRVVVSVVPVSSPGPMPGTVELPINLPTEGTTLGSTTEGHQEHHKPLGLSLPVLLSLLALLLFLLVGTSLLAWRMFQKRLGKVDIHPELAQNLRQVRELRQEGSEQSETQYVNLQLRTWPLKEEPVLPSHVEVEYSTVEVPQKELHYMSVAFDSQGQDSHAHGNSPQLQQGQEAEYSEVRKP